MLKLYENIRIYRKRAKLTQDELARRAGYTDRSSIAKIEKGLVDLSQTKIKQFADIFGVTPSTLMGWEETQKENDTLADIVIRLRTDPDFMSVVKILDELDSEKLAGVQQMLSAFRK